MKIFYKTRATATGGRAGRTQLDDGTLALDLAVPGWAMQLVLIMHYHLQQNS